MDRGRLSAGEVWAHLLRWDGSGGDADVVDGYREVLEWPEWRRLEVLLDQIETHDGVDGDTADEYAGRPLRTAPEVVLVPGRGRRWSALDGSHRVRAAQARGDAAHPAFVPLDRAPAKAGR